MRELEQYFKALADISRLRILNLLLHGELCVCDIQYVLDATQPNVSRHLSYLKNSGLVVDRRDGYRIFYRLADPKQGTKKRLFEFLQQAYKSESQLAADSKRLREAIAAGACTLAEWKPYSVMGGAKAMPASRG
jgi:ArsR family transcriptional regulator